MKQILSTLLLIIIPLGFVTAQKSNNNDEIIDKKKATKDILKVFKEYKNAILSGNSDLAIKQIDKNSFDYYQEVLNLSLRADSTQINQLEVLDKLMVLSVRHRVPKANLLKMNGKELLTYSIDNGMIAKSTVEHIEMGEIDINGEIAYGEFLINNQKTPLYFGFTYDQSQWRFDVTSVFEPTGFAIRKLMKMQNKTDNDVILMMIQSSTPDQKVEKNIWKPIL